MGPFWQRTSVLRKVAGAIRNIALSKDASLLVAGGQGGIEVWSLSTRSRQLGVGLGYPVSTVTFNRSENLLAVSGDNRVEVLSFPALKRLWPKPIGKNQIDSSVLFGTQGNYVIVGRRGYDLDSSEFQRRAGNSFSILRNRICYSTDWKLAFDGRTVILANRYNQSPLKTWPRVWNDNPSALAGGQKQFLTRASNGAVSLFDGEKEGDGPGLVMGGHRGPVKSVCFSSDFKYAFSGGEDGLIKKWKLVPDSLGVGIDKFSAIKRVACSADGQRIAVGDDKGKVVVLQRKPLQQLFSLKVRDEEYYDLAFSPDSKYLAIQIDDLELRDSETGSLFKSFRGKIGAFSCIRFSSDGRYLATIAGSNLRVWDAKIESLPRELWSAHVGQAKDIFFTSDDKKLVHQAGNRIRAWELETGVESKINEFQHGERETVVSLCISEDKTKLATATSTDIHVWNWNTGQLLKKFPSGIDESQKGTIRLAFTHDTKRLISWGTRTRIWDWKTGKELRSFPPSAFAIRPDWSELVIVNRTQDGLQLEFLDCSEVSK